MNSCRGARALITGLIFQLQVHHQLERSPFLPRLSTPNSLSLAPYYHGHDLDFASVVDLDFASVVDLDFASVVDLDFASVVDLDFASV